MLAEFTVRAWMPARSAASIWLRMSASSGETMTDGPAPREPQQRGRGEVDRRLAPAGALHDQRPAAVLDQGADRCPLVLAQSRIRSRRGRAGSALPRRAVSLARPHRRSCSPSYQPQPTIALPTAQADWQPAWAALPNNPLMAAGPLRSPGWLLRVVPDVTAGGGLACWPGKPSQGKAAPDVRSYGTNRGSQEHRHAR